MPVAVVFLLRAVVLVLLWGFVIAAIVAVRHDVFDTGPARSRRAARATAAATAAAAVPSAPRPAAAAAPPPPPVAAGRSRGRSNSPATATQLVVVEGPSAGVSVALSSLPVTIGRAGDVTLILADDYVSQHHAQLVPRGQEWLIHDSGSTNGTFVGDTRVTAPVVVPVGGRFRIGRNVLELRG